MPSLELPHRGDSNEYTKYTIFSKNKRKLPLIFPNLQLWDFFSKGLKNEFETAVLNEPSVFKLLKFYCSCINHYFWHLKLFTANQSKLI